MDMPVGAARGDFAIGCDDDGIERRRQINNCRRALSPQRPEAHGRVVSCADERFAVGRKGDRVDVLLIALEHGRCAAGERPQANRAIPGCGSERGTVGRYGERGDRSAVAFEDHVGPRTAVPPDRDARIGAARDRAAVPQDRDRVHRIVVQSHHLFGDSAIERPADRGRVKASGKCGRTVLRYRQRTHRPAMPDQLRAGRRGVDGGSEQKHRCENTNPGQSHAIVLASPSDRRRAWHGFSAPYLRFCGILSRYCSTKRGQQ